MRNGPVNFELLLRSTRTSNRHLSISYRLLLGIVVCFATLMLHAQIFPGTPNPGESALAPAQQAPSPSPSPAATPANQAVPLPQIVDQAEALERQLRETSESPEPLADFSFSETEVKRDTTQFDQRARQTEQLLAGIPSMMQLQDEDWYWRTLAEQYGNQRKLLTIRGSEIEKKMRWLENEQRRWQATWDEVQLQQGIDVVAQRVRNILHEIHGLHEQAQEQLSQILTAQNRISEQEHATSAMLRKLEDAREHLRGRLFERDSHPLWVAQQARPGNRSTNVVVYVFTGSGFAGTRNFLRAHAALLTGAAVLYLCVLLTTFRFRSYLAAKSGPNATQGMRVFSRPFSVALLLALIMTIGATSSAPTGVSFIVSLFYLVPVLRLLPPLVGSEMRKAVYTLSAFYLLGWTYLVLQFDPVYKRVVFALVIFLALIIFTWLTRPARLKVQPAPAWQTKLMFAGTSGGLVLLAASLLANVVGFVSLSQVLGLGVLFSAFTFAWVYTTVRILLLGISIAIKSAWFQSLPGANAVTIERWAGRLLVLGAAILWINIALHLFVVRQSVLSALRDVLQFQIGYGKIHVTLGGTLSLLLLLLLGYAIANIASFFLGSILLPKAPLKGGMAYAISRITYYVLLVGLFFAALSSAGVELDKFTVITGALGVGVGFGLQNIVNNFASGLIVLLERPIRVSDTVEVAGVVGIVRRIGARSSTVLTAQGAEVIIPNSNLVSNQVINWTLSSPRRRVEIPVGVSYSTDPEIVLKLLTEVATTNTRVLTHPPVEAAFLGFGESALRFQLAFWASQSAWFELQSEVGLAVFRSLRQAGIEIPLPQRELHLRSANAAFTEELSKAADDAPRRKMIAG